MSLENPTFLESLSTHKKAVGITLLVFIAILGIVFYLGSTKGREWADSEYLQERQKAVEEIAVHKANEQRLALENERIKTENEAKAELLLKNDAKIAGDIQKFTDLQKQREEKRNEIENASDNDTISGLCADAKSSGITFSFCR